MSFKVKEKTIYLSMIGVIAVVVVCTFCAIAYKNPTDYADTLKMVLMLILGSLFKSDNGKNDNTP